MTTRSNVLFRIGLAAMTCLASSPAESAAADNVPEGPTRLLRFAVLSRDRVVFAYAGDLWIAAREGGSARRLTSNVGDERYSKFSPDGEWIAFTGEYDGNPDVYVIPADGGEPRRLTFHPSFHPVFASAPIALTSAIIAMCPLIGSEAPNTHPS